MPDQTDNQPPIQYTICIAGRIEPARMAWFEGISLTVQQTGDELCTMLTVAVPDQPALFGILARIRDLGIRLISISQIPFNKTDTKDK